MILPTSRASPSRLSPRIAGVNPASRATVRGRFERALRRGDHADRRVREPRIAGLDRFTRGGFQHARDRGRHFDPVAANHVQGVGAGRRVGNCRPRRDRDRIVARYIGDQQRHHLCGVAGRGEPPALDRRQMAAHAIHLADRRARLEQRAIDVLLVVEREAVRRQREQRGAAARDQRDHEIVGGEAANHREHAFRGSEAGCIGHRMRGLDDLDSLARHRVAVARDDEPGDIARPMILERPRHRCRRLAGADDDRAVRRAAAADAAARSAPAAPRRSPRRTSCATTRVPPTSPLPDAVSALRGFCPTSKLASFSSACTSAE